MSQYELAYSIEKIRKVKQNKACEECPKHKDSVNVFSYIK